ncbi:MAG: hypothetical protein Q9209_003111 [Squamulea sp. 1 TL-2023]
MGQACSVLAEHLFPPLPPETTALDLLAAGLGIGLLDYEDDNVNRQVSGVSAPALPSVSTSRDDHTPTNQKNDHSVVMPAVTLVDGDGEQPSAEEEPLGSSTHLCNQANNQRDTNDGRLLNTRITPFEKDTDVKRGADKVGNQPIGTTTAAPPEDAGRQRDIEDARSTSVADAGTEADTPNLARGDELLDTMTAKLTNQDHEHQEPAEHMPVQHKDFAACLIRPTTAILSVSDTLDNLSDSAFNNSHIHSLKDMQLKHSTIAAADPVNVQMLLARITRLEGVVDQQKNLLKAQAAQTIHNGTDSKVWANRSTAPIEETDAGAWAAAAYDSLARTAADRARRGKQQGDTIIHLYARVNERDLTIEERNGKISQLEKRIKSMSLRGTFSRADAAVKQSARSKQLQEELDAEKAGREADTKNAKEDMATVMADAAKALADLKEQSRTELATMIHKHQSEISDSITAHHEMEKNNVNKIQDLENLVATMKNNDINRSKRNRDLMNDRDSANKKYIVVEQRCRKAQQALKEQTDGYQTEKQDFVAKIAHTEEQLTVAESTIESLRDKLDASVEKEKLLEDAMNLYQDEADEKDENICTLNKAVELMMADKAVLEQEVKTCGVSRMQAELNHNAQIQALRTTKDKKEEENASLKAHIENSKQHNEEEALRKDTKMKRLEDERDSSLKNVLEQIEIINIYQGEVEARDEKIRDLEDQIRALCSHAAQSANTAATLPSTLTHPPAAFPSSRTPSSSNQPLRSTSPAPHGYTPFLGLMASSIPLPPSPPPALSPSVSPVSFPSSTHSPRSLPASDVSLIDTDLPPVLDDSYSQELLSEMGYPSESASESSEIAVSVPYEVEAPAQSSSRFMFMEDEAENQEALQLVDLSTAAPTCQRLITWPYNIPTLSITWQEELNGEAPSFFPHDGSIEQATGQPEGSGSMSTPTLSLPGTTSDRQSFNTGNAATEKPSSMQGPGEAHENKDKQQDEPEETPASPVSETASSSVQTKDGTETSAAHSNTSISELSDAAHQESPRKPAPPSADLNLATQTCSQGSGASGEPSGSVGTRMGRVGGGRPGAGPSRELDSGSKPEEQPQMLSSSNVVTIANPWSTPADGFLPTLVNDSSDNQKPEEVSNDEDDIPMPEAPCGQLPSDTTASITSPAPRPADDTSPISVNNSSQDRKEEEINDNGDDPMGEAVRYQLVLSLIQQLIFTQPRGWDFEDDFEMGDRQHAADLLSSDEFDQEMADSAPGQVESLQGPMPSFSTDYNQTVLPVEDAKMDDVPTQLSNMLPGNSMLDNTAYTTWAPAITSIETPTVPPQNQSSEDDMHLSDIAVATVIHAWNKSHDLSGAPINEIFSQPGSSSGIHGQALNGFEHNDHIASPPTPVVKFGNHDQAQGPSVSGQFSFGQRMTAPQPIFQDTAAFGQQLPQPSFSFNQLSSPSTMGFGPWTAHANAVHDDQTQYPDPIGLQLAPRDTILDLTGAQTSDLSGGQKRPDTADDSLEVGWMDDYDATFGTGDGVSEVKKYRPDGSLFTPHPKIRRLPRPSGPTLSQPAVSACQTLKQTVSPIFGIIPSTPYPTSRSRKIAQRIAQRIDSQRPDNAHVPFSGYPTQTEKTADEYIDPQLLGPNRDTLQLPQPTGSEILISPKSPTESEALSAEYEDEPSRPLATNDELVDYLMEHMDDSDSEEGESGEKAHAYVQDNEPEPDLPEYEESGDALCGDQQFDNEQSQWSAFPIPGSYHGSPSSPGITYPQNQKPVPSPASPTPSGSSPETHSTHPTTPERVSSKSPEEDDSKTQAPKGVPPKQRTILPLPRRRRAPRPEAADFFSIESKPNDLALASAPRKKTRPVDSSTNPSQQDPPPPAPIGILPGLLTGKTRPENPEENLNFRDRALYLPGAPKNGFEWALNEDCQARKDLDEGEIDPFPNEVVPGSKGNGSGKKRGGDEAEIEYKNREGADDEKPVNRMPWFNPNTLKGLSEKELKGEISVPGAGPSAPPPPSHSNSPAAYTSSRPCQNTTLPPRPSPPSPSWGPTAPSPSSYIPHSTSIFTNNNNNTNAYDYDDSIDGESESDDFDAEVFYNEAERAERLEEEKRRIERAGEEHRVQEERVRWIEEGEED